ncbi:hypothetical protein AX17_005260 [Amanita inopinata Kibby_2008]|nr:hypothetical protein AX17_005260 [Amanita inopinata Kibby_2008]
MSRANSGILSARFNPPSEGRKLSKKSKPDSTHPRPLFTKVQPSAASKGKNPIRGGDYCESPVPAYSPENGLHDQDTFALHPPAGPSSLNPHPASTNAPPSSDIMFTKRGSILVAASDALGFKFGRKRQSTRTAQRTDIFSDVIEISALRPDAESEERERLREEAAQSLGIAVDQDSPSVTQSIEEENDRELHEAPSHVSDAGNAARSISATPDIDNRSHHDPHRSLPSSINASAAARRPNSAMAHNRRGSNMTTLIPPFPASIDALDAFKQLSASLPKYYPSPSLRIFALSKNWKIRFLILTSPPVAIPKNSRPAVSYLHLFKSSSTGEKETERLEINEDSVVFVAEEDVGGRKNVIKVGGRDEGCANNAKKDHNCEEGGRTMWFLQISDPTESQKWIATIKNVILSQRTIRAGLGLPANALGGIEPRGDMDVMLSIRQQGIVTSPSSSRQSVGSPRSVLPEVNYASSVSSQSLHSQATTPRSQPSVSSISGLKGLFTSRPRATSRATSFDSERPLYDKENEDSFVSVTSVLNKLRPNTAESDTSFVPPLSSFTTVPHALQRKIVNEQMPTTSADATENGNPTTVNDKANRPLSLGALSLQPPPRKRWMFVETKPSTMITITDMSNELLAGQSESHQPSSPRSGRLSSFGSTEQKPRPPSIQSISTLASGDHSIKSNVSTQRSTRRWSRQSALPARMSPPNGPPPAVPPTVQLQQHPYAAERSSSQTSFSNSTDSPKSIISGLPSFSKRASNSSAFSVKTTGTSHSHSYPVLSNSRPTSSHRASMPPPSKPPPTTALPPAPGQMSTSAPSSKPSFRESFANRAGRLSIISPKPPPSAILPPRPDEPTKSHRRSSSGNYFVYPSNSNPSSSSLIPNPLHSASPFPPPSVPLPPTPATQPVLASSSRQSLIKRRLRMLSTPAPSPTEPSTIENAPTNHSRRRSTTVTATIVQDSKQVSHHLISTPTTPIAEKITLFQNDPSFLQLDTPTIPSRPPPRPLPPIPTQYPDMVSLSPPPRRSSKHITTVDIAEFESKPASEGENRLVSLSRPGSVVSLGIVSM